MVRLTNVEALLYALTAAVEKALSERDAERKTADDLRQHLLRQRSREYDGGGIAKCSEAAGDCKAISPESLRELRKSADMLADFDGGNTA